MSVRTDSTVVHERPYTAVMQPAVAGGKCHLMRLARDDFNRLRQRVNVGKTEATKVDILQSMYIFRPWPSAVSFRFLLGLAVRRMRRHVSAVLACPAHSGDTRVRPY